MGEAHTGPAFRGPVFEPVSGDDPAAVSGHRISARLGDGGPWPARDTCRTYLAHAPGGQPVALTVIRPEEAGAAEFGARFLPDAQAAGRVRGPFTVPVVGSGKEGERYWFASAYVPALSLRAAVSAGGPLPTGAVLRLVAGLAEGLQSVHHAGVVHGGLRPSHVLLAADGPRIKSYGLGWVGDEEEATAYRAPEQAAGKAASAATDVFALGQIAAYASIGAAPFGDGSRVQQAEPDLNELPGQLREIVTRCLIKDPALRPSLAQITAMCAQAAPERSQPSPWLPAPLLGAVLAAVPPGGPEAAPVPPSAPASAGPVPPPPMAAPHPAPVPTSAPPAMAPPGLVPPPPSPPMSAPPPPAPMAASASPSTPPPPAPAAMSAPGPVPVPPHPAPVPAAPPAHPAPVPMPPPPHPAPAPRQAHGGGFLWHPQQWPRAPYVHVPLPLPRRRKRALGVVAGLAGFAVAVTTGMALAGGFGESGSAAAPGRPPAGAAAPTPSGPTAPSAVPPTTDGGGATGAPEPRPGAAYQGVRLPAGYGVSVRSDPPIVQDGTYSGDFGLTPRADAFAVEARHGTLALLAPQDPGTLDGCRAATAPQATSVPVGPMTPGTRLCVRSADGTTTLVTVRQLTAPGDHQPSVLIDLTVWRITPALPPTAPPTASTTADPAPTVHLLTAVDASGFN